MEQKQYHGNATVIPYKGKGLVIPLENEDSIVSNVYKREYYKSKELQDIFIEFLQLRKTLKAVNSERAIKMLLNTLEKFDDDTKIKMIEQSIVSSWKDVYPLKSQKESAFEKGRRILND